VIVHVADLTGGFEDRDPADDVRIIDEELVAHASELGSRPRVLVGNKIDMPDTAEASARLERIAAERNIPYHAVSAVTGEGIDPFVASLAGLVRQVREETPREVEEHEARYIIRPTESDGGFEVARTSSDSFRVTGADIERMVIMTELDNEEAVAYLQKRLVRAGVEEALLAEGAVDGDEIEIAGATFEFETGMGDDESGTEAGEEEE
jgi:GTP-binding protein